MLFELGGRVTSSGAKKGFPSAEEEEEDSDEGNVDADEDDTDNGLL